MNIFPAQPEVSAADTLRIRPHLKNKTVARAWIKTAPPTDDLKRAVLIEMFQAVEKAGRTKRSPLTHITRGIHQDLIVAIQKNERAIIDDTVMGVLAKAVKPNNL
jgi:hypothetical protein